MGSQRNTINFIGDFVCLPGWWVLFIKPFRDHLHGGRKGVQGSNGCGWGGQARSQKEKTEHHVREKLKESPSQRKGIWRAVRRKMGTHHGRQETLIFFPETTWARLAPKRSVTLWQLKALVKCEQTYNNNFCWSLQFGWTYLNCVRRDTGESHSHAHSWKYVSKS